MSNIKKTIEGKVKMPNKIIIGDPMYFEECPDRKDLVYAKNFRGKDNWLGYISLKEVEEEFEMGNEIYKSISYVFNIIFAPTNDKLEVYKQGKYYSHQKQKETVIGVDTARYYIEMGERSDTINTGGDGCWGSVLEFYDKSKLDGILIDLAFPDDLFDFEDCKKELEYLLDFKF